MVRRPDLTSPAQHCESSKIGIPRPVDVHRSFWNRAKDQLPAATTNSGPLPRPTRRTAGQPSIQAPRCTPRKPVNRVPAIHQGPAPHRPRSKSPGQGSSASRHRFKMAPRSISYSSGTSSTRRRAPQLSPGIRGPQQGPLAISPRCPGHQEHLGGRPVSRPRPRLTPRSCCTPTAGPRPAPLAGAAQPGSDRRRRARDTRRG
ncbi:hypothetical protein NDU88_002944 [Pleurodeles waltl]|uniref:Uncharacterized protein n=1 Tax=Pleurodeles waltl TaxID=8319 RepID=A0AAV7TPR2_PLEWA|nr:hypothetical protein NDU88_002944 [Pleurodeles waltl]